MTARDPGDISFGLDGVTQGAAREAAAVFCHVRQLTGQFLRAAANARAHGQEADQAGRPRAQSHSPHAGGMQLQASCAGQVSPPPFPATPRSAALLPQEVARACRSTEWGRRGELLARCRSCAAVRLGRKERGGVRCRGWGVLLGRWCAHVAYVCLRECILACGGCGSVDSRSR